jgi:hypothetical protein
MSVNKLVEQHISEVTGIRVTFSESSYPYIKKAIDELIYDQGATPKAEYTVTFPRSIENERLGTLRITEDALTNINKDLKSLSKNDLETLCVGEEEDMAALVTRFHLQNANMLIEYLFESEIWD